jgi:hypothetical protein
VSRGECEGTEGHTGATWRVVNAIMMLMRASCTTPLTCGRVPMLIVRVLRLKYRACLLEWQPATASEANMLSPALAVAGQR